MFDKYELFDSHMHIINKKFSLVENNGYLPDEFLIKDYKAKLSAYNLRGGVVVSGSFQAYDQSYLLEALEQLGQSFVGVTQLPYSVSDQDILFLNQKGVRAIRFNLKRGGSEELSHLASMASRIHELVNWHVELYVDSKHLDGLYQTLIQLPAVSIDHLGLNKTGFKTLCCLLEKGVMVKATGFGRVNFDVVSSIKTLYSINPDALMFGTDLPSTRAPRAYSDEDFDLILENFEQQAVLKILSQNAIKFYRPSN